MLRGSYLLAFCLLLVVAPEASAHSDEVVGWAMLISAVLIAGVGAIGGLIAGLRRDSRPSFWALAKAYALLVVLAPALERMASGSSLHLSTMLYALLFAAISLPVLLAGFLGMRYIARIMRVCFSSAAD
jgi:hypothetical protein